MKHLTIQKLMAILKNIASYRTVFSASLGHYNERVRDGQFIEIVLVSDFILTHEYEHIMQEIPAMYIKNGFVYVKERHICIHIDLQYVKLPKLHKTGDWI